MQPIKLDSVLRTYRLYAPIYDFVFGAVLEPGRQALAERVCGIRPTRLLEIGVGTGLLLEKYPATTSIVGIDVSEPMLTVARKRIAHLPSRSIALHAMNAEQMDFPDGHFDCVALPYVLSVTPNPEKLIAEVRRVCRKDGTILVLNHFSGSKIWWLLEQIARPISNRIGFRSSFQFGDQIASHSWRIQSVRSVNLFGLSKLVELRNA